MSSPEFAPDDWEMHVAGSRVSDDPDMLLIVGLLARMADATGEIDIDPGHYPEGSDEQYMAMLLNEMADEEEAAGRPANGWRLAYGKDAQQSA